VRNFFSKHNKKIAAGSIAIFFSLSLILSFAGLVGAQAIDYVPLAPLPGIGTDPEIGPPEPITISSYLAAAFRLSIGLAALLAVVMITVGGFQYLSTDVISGKEDGREKINNALLGLFLAMGAWLFLYTINPKLVEFDFNISTPPPVEIPGGNPPPSEFRKEKYCYAFSERYQQVDPEIIGVFPYTLDQDGSSLREAHQQCNNTPPTPHFDRPAPNECSETQLETIRCVRARN
jgi:hypothetical protein